MQTKEYSSFRSRLHSLSALYSICVYTEGKEFVKCFHSGRVIMGKDSISFVGEGEGNTLVLSHELIRESGSLAGNSFCCGPNNGNYVIVKCYHVSPWGFKEESPHRMIEKEDEEE